MLISLSNETTSAGIRKNVVLPGQRKSSFVPKKLDHFQQALSDSPLTLSSQPGSHIWVRAPPTRWALTLSGQWLTQRTEATSLCLLEALPPRHLRHQAGLSRPAPCLPSKSPPSPDALQESHVGGHAPPSVSMRPEPVPASEL